jgi:hypothetical protein
MPVKLVSTARQSTGDVLKLVAPKMTIAEVYVILIIMRALEPVNLKIEMAC